MKLNSLKNNATANFLGQCYTIIIAIVITPLYLQYLGAEAYGLVGFFALMQAWLGLLDMGLSPTLARQVSYARGSENGFELFKRILKSFELIFLILGILITLSILYFSEWIALNWVNAQNLPKDTIISCVVLMGGLIGLRWFSGLYRSGINGFEDQIWLNITNVFLISLKFLGALFLLAFITTDIRLFFLYQIFISLIEIYTLNRRFYKKLPQTKNSPWLFDFDYSAVKSVAPFAMSITYTAGLWVIVSQTDKLILSGILNLSEYGYFSLVALLASGITTTSGAISKAMMPRMTMLLAQNKKEEMLVIYRQGSQIVTLISFSIAMVIGLYGNKLLFAWTGNRAAAEWGSDIIIWFALGNGVLAIGAFQYYLQSAIGKLRLHVIGSTITATIQVPIIFWAATNYSALGTGIAWFLFHTIGFLIWTPIVHKRYLPGFHLKWLIREILPIIFVVFLLSVTLNNFFELSLNTNRFILLMEMVLIGGVLLSVSSLSLPFVFKRLIKKLK